MPKYLLSKEQHDYLVSIIEGRRVSEVTKMLNEHFGTSFTEKQIDAYKHNHKLKSGINPGRCLGSCRKYTMEQIEYLREIAPGRGTDEIARMFNERWGTNYTRQQIQSIKKNYKIVSSWDARFKKGHVPVNKGTTGMFNVGGNIGSFSRGHRPDNWCPIGTETESKDGYVYVKIADKYKGKKKDNWKAKHILIYEKAHGPIPEGYKCAFLDGNRRNYDLDNLILVSKAESAYMARKRLYTDDKELTRSGVALARLGTTIAKKGKNK